MLPFSLIMHLAFADNVGTCNNGVLEPNEQCDRMNFRGKTCQSYRYYGSGNLVCTPDCAISTDKCGTSIQSSMEQFDIRRFGAVANDGIDDSAAIQKAMDACLATATVTENAPSETYTVHVPIGIFEIDGTIRGQCSLEGESRSGSTLKYSGTAPLTMLLYDAKAHFSIKNLVFYTVNDNLQMTHIHIKDSTYFHIQDVTSFASHFPNKNNRVTGIHVEGTASGPDVPPRGSGHITNYVYTSTPLAAQRTGAYGIHIHGNGQSILNVVVDGYYNIEEADVGIFIENAEGNTIIGNGIIQGHATANIKLINADGNLISGADLRYPGGGPDDPRFALGSKHISVDTNSEDNTFIGINCFEPGICANSTSPYGLRPVVLSGGNQKNFAKIGPLVVGSEGDYGRPQLVVGTKDNPTKDNKVNSQLIIGQSDGATGLAVMNQLSGDRRFALNPNADGSWTMYDGANGIWNKGLSQKAGNINVSGRIYSKGDICTDLAGGKCLSSASGGNSYWTNVRDFGAKGDSVTDDTAAIQAAVDSLHNGGMVYFPPGIYLTNGVVVKKDYIRLVGVGRASILRAIGNNEVIVRFSASNGGVEDMRLSCNGKIATTGLGVMPVATAVGGLCPPLPMLSAIRTITGSATCSLIPARRE